MAARLAAPQFAAASASAASSAKAQRAAAIAPARAAPASVEVVEKVQAPPAADALPPAVDGSDTPQPLVMGETTIETFEEPAEAASAVAEKTVMWTGENHPEAMKALKTPGGLIVSPTKVGYVIITTDKAGLERKFAVKERKRNKPGVVLCGSMEQLKALADMTPEVEAFYQAHWDQDVLMGCICPWKETGLQYIPDDGSRELMMDGRKTSCFVIRFGTPSEQVAAELWAADESLIFASSANPSGKGNRGSYKNVGEKIEQGVDVIVAANDYVAAQQPNKTVETRYEQGVMVSMVDADGKLVPEQKGERGVTPCPTLIRKGLAIDTITDNMCDLFTSWDYRQGAYY